MEYSSQETYEMHAIVYGNVQGVGFRALTRQQAKKMGIGGTVRNLPDGTVEILAQGSKKSLEELIHILKKEMSSGGIENVKIDYSPIEEPHLDFRIVH